ncbi:MAG: bifunctional metallophosphatase/5'-nucleotidase [Acidobacteria bacterium]|nr:bifunctional metallophosphatase/5'-nucleotidase [Acidobacteriota bacterium]
MKPSANHFPYRRLVGRAARRTALAVALFFTLQAVLLLAAPPEGHTHITILHVNDIHGFMRPFMDKSAHPDHPVGGSAYLSGLIAELRAANPGGTLLVSAGDMFQGTAVSNRFYGKPMVEVMNYLGFDGMAVGNHEFDWGVEKLNEMIAGAKFPFLAANLTDDQGKPLPGIKPYVIIERSGLKIALVGLCSTSTPQLTFADHVRGLRFQAPEVVLPPIMKELRAKGARLVVVLSHLGLRGDEELAEKVPGIDAIVGGHVHAPLFEPVLRGKTAIVQAGCYGIFLGVLNLRVPKDPGAPVEVEAGSTLRRIIAGPNAPWDAAADRLVANYYDRIADEYAEVVGEAAVELVHPPSGESNLGNLLCDALRAKTGADIAVQNSGGIRAGIPKGRITLEHVMAVYPFENKVVTVEMSGKDVRTLFEEMPFWGKTSLQVSGARIVYVQDPRAHPRLKSIAVGGQALDESRTYRVTINDFLLKGGDGYEIFSRCKTPVIGPPVRDTLVEYIRAHSPVSPAMEGRITVE